MANYGGSDHDSEEDGRAAEMGFQQEDRVDEDEGEGAGLAQARNDGNEIHSVHITPLRGLLWVFVCGCL